MAVSNRRFNTFCTPVILQGLGHTLSWHDGNPGEVGRRGVQYGGEFLQYVGGYLPQRDRSKLRALPLCRGDSKLPAVKYAHASLKGNMYLCNVRRVHLLGDDVNYEREVTPLTRSLQPNMHVPEFRSGLGTAASTLVRPRILWAVDATFARFRSFPPLLGRRPWWLAFLRCSLCCCRRWHQLGYDGRLCAAGKDCLIEFFDLRKAGKPLGTYTECHTDAVTQVCYCRVCSGRSVIASRWH